jgi:hypothetical protein
MKNKTIALIAAASLLPALVFAQSTPPVPPVSPAAPAAAVPPVPPGPRGPHDHDRDRGPKVPITFLGVETSEVPSVVAEQLGLAKGFGLVVDYVVPEGPAAAAGLQQNDILKMLNDQILTEPDQLAKLIRSFSEGTSVTLTVLRKGAETKLTAKLGKREVSQRRGGDSHWRGRDGQGFGQIMGPEFEEKMNHLQDQMGEMNFGMFDPEAMKTSVDQAREEARNAQREVREQARTVQREAREAARDAARAARDAAREFRVSRQENGALKTTRIDMNKAQIVYHDAQGELKLENVAGKKVLTAKDAQGRLVFSGPVETKEELDKLPPDVRQRYDKLEQKDLPAIAPNVTSDEQENDANMNIDADDNDNDSDSDDESDGDAVLQVINANAGPSSESTFDLNIVLI